MGAEAIELETSGESPYAHLVRPKFLLGQWATRTWRTSPDEALLWSTAWNVINALNGLIDLPLTSVSMNIRRFSEEEAQQVEQSQADQAESLTALLEAVRELRNHLRSQLFERLRAAVRRQADVASKLSSRRTAALDRLAEWEKLLVFLGAGTADDAHLGKDFIPPASDEPPTGPSAGFDL